MLPPGKQDGKCREMGDVPCAETTFDGRDEVLDLREAFEADEFGYLDRAKFADFPEVIAQQVRYHHQFGHFFVAGLEFIGELGSRVGSEERGRVPLIGRD